MCGIAGWVGPGARTKVESMISVVEHRGPDGGGIYAADNVSLGHRRLAILDLSKDGSQPMARGPITVVFNGEIYNYIELRSQLEMGGHRFRSSSDTEVLLAAYETWGTGCVERFDGMWSFALHDPSRNLLFCSRDRFGEKPFLFNCGPDYFAFGSEAKQLRRVGLGLAADAVSVHQYLTFGRPLLDDSTFYRGISALPPGHNMLVDIDTLDVETVRYYRPGEMGLFDDVGKGDLPEVFRAEIGRSISNRLRSDVSVGVLLSGGVDSSLIASLAGPEYFEKTGSRMKAVTAITGDPQNDESTFAQSVARSSHLEWIPVSVNRSEAREGWVEATSVIEQPLGSSSSVMQLRVMQHAKRQGIKVLLDGQGADESWLGYPRYLVWASRHVSPARRWQFERAAADRASLTMGQLLTNRAYFGHSWVAAGRQMLRNRSVGLAAPIRSTIRGQRGTIPAVRAPLADLQRHEIQGQQLGQLLRHADLTSMSVSIEDRLPFLDYRLVELALSVSVDTLFFGGWSKWLLRAQLAEAAGPDVAFRRKKIGFEAHSGSFDPSDRRVRQAIHDSAILREMGLKSKGIRASPLLMWRLFSVGLWEAVCDVRA